MSDTADIKDNDNLLAGGMVVDRHIVDEFALNLREFKIVFDLAVGALAGIATDDNDSHIVLCGLVIFNITVIEVHEILINCEPRVLETVNHIDNICLVHIAGTCAARHEIDGSDTVESHLLVTLEGECTGLVAEDYVRGNIADYQYYLLLIICDIPNVFPTIPRNLMRIELVLDLLSKHSNREIIQRKKYV